MKIKLSPVRSDESQPKVTVRGDVLTVAGEKFDFGPLALGSSIPASAIKSAFFAGPASRTDAGIELTLTLYHGANPPQSMAYPEPLEVTSGAVHFPVMPAAEVADEH